MNSPLLDHKQKKEKIHTHDSKPAHEYSSMGDVAGFCVFVRFGEFLLVIMILVLMCINGSSREFTLELPAGFKQYLSNYDGSSQGLSEELLIIKPKHPWINLE